MTVCSRCRTNKPEPFYSSHCKACRREIYQEKKNGTYVYKEKLSELEQKRRRNARTYANRSGIKKQPCIDCGTLDNLEMHHDDYSKPLEVTWLCKPCHNKRHR